MAVRESATGEVRATSGERLFKVGLGVFVLSWIGFALAWIFNWPSDFVIGEVADSTVNAADIFTGTATSAPLPPLIVLTVGLILVRSPRWWGTVGAGLLTLVGVVFTIGGIGELTSDSQMVAKAVLVVAGIAWMIVGSTLAITGVMDLRARRA